MGGVKDKSMSHFKTNTIKDLSKPKNVNNVYWGGKKPRKATTKNHLRENTIKDVKNSFRLKNKMKESKTKQ